VRTPCIRDDDRARSEPEVQREGPHHELPYAAWWPALAGALTGVLLRLVFMGGPDGIYAATSFGRIGGRTSTCSTRAIR